MQGRWKKRPWAPGLTCISLATLSWKENQKRGGDKEREEGLMELRNLSLPEASAGWDASPVSTWFSVGEHEPAGSPGPAGSAATGTSRGLLTLLEEWQGSKVSDMVSCN